MGLLEKNPDMNNMRNLYIEQLRDLYSAESQLVDALPKLVESAHSKSLKKAFSSHLEETKGQKQRLETIFDKLGEKPTGHTCKGMKGLIAEGEEMLDRDGNPSVRDAGLIAAAQRVEHYEISGYGTARQLASQLGDAEAARLLEETLNEESSADEKLNRIAMEEIKVAAPQAR